jgi:hypothetical protein
MIKSRRTRWAGHAARMGAKRKAYRLLMGKPDGKRQVGTPINKAIMGPSLLIIHTQQEATPQ